MKCLRCEIDHDGSYGSGKYCSKKCAYFKDDKFRSNISSKLNGISRPYNKGIKNPNYGGKYTHNPEIFDKMISAAKIRGQSWNEDLKLQHSLKMKGNSNWMRGKHHTEDTKKKIRDTILDDFNSGKRKINKIMISKSEREINTLLQNIGYKTQLGFRIKDGVWLYDIFVPEKNLIIEYNGDYWHCNPLKYSADYFNKSANKTAKEIWDKDETKKIDAINNGFKYCRIWENDYKNNDNKTEMLISLLNKI